MKNTGLVKRCQAFGTGDGTSQLGARSEKEGIRCSKVGMEFGNAVPSVPNARHHLTEGGSKLDVVGLRKQGAKMVGQCPVCAQAGGDKQRNHLVVQADGRFGCVVHPGPSGKEHRRQIFQLIGDKHGKSRQHLPATPLDISLL